jgi:hypothetical protein
MGHSRHPSDDNVRDPGNARLSDSRGHAMCCFTSRVRSGPPARRIAFRPVLEILQQKAPPLRAGRGLDEATDAFTIYGDSTYRLLTSERGWSYAMVIE